MLAMEAAALEALIDRVSLAKVLDVVAEICNAKAVHIQGHWQDDALSSQWRQASLKVARIALDAGNRGL